jgi:hypothetical protein
MNTAHIILHATGPIAAYSEFSQAFAVLTKFPEPFGDDCTIVSVPVAPTIEIHDSWLCATSKDGECGVSLDMGIPEILKHSENLDRNGSASMPRAAGAGHAALPCYK